MSTERMLGEIEAARRELEAKPGATWTVAHWRDRLLDSGVTRIDLPVSLGGSPTRNADLMPILLRLGAINLNLRDVAGIGHSRLMADSEEPRLRRLGIAASTNQVCTSIAATEHGAGSDLGALRCAARKVSGGFRLDGRKVAIYRLEEATHFAVVAKLDDELHLFVCAAGSEGMHVEPRRCVGLRANSWGELELRDVFVPEHCWLSRSERGVEMFSRHFTFWRTAMAVCAIGAARAALNATARWLGQRRAFGKLLLDDGGIRRELERHRGHLYNYWLVARRVAERLDAGEGQHILLERHVKAGGIRAAYEAVDWCIEHHGWRGCEESFPLVEVQRNLACLRISSGSAEALVDSLARRSVRRVRDGAASPGADHYDWPL